MASPSHTGIITGWIKIRSYTVGVSDSEIIPEISIYPNPFHKELNIELKTIFPKVTKVSIYNLKGQKIWERKIDKNSSNSLIWDGKDINHKSLPSGIYLLKIDINKEITYLYKVVKF